MICGKILYIPMTTELEEMEIGHLCLEIQLAKTAQQFLIKNGSLQIILLQTLVKSTKLIQLLILILQIQNNCHPVIQGVNIFPRKYMKIFLYSFQK